MINTFQKSLVSAGSMSSSFTSTILNTDHVTGFSVEAEWTGTPSGTLSLQCSNDGTNWVDIADSAQTLSGSAGTFVWNVSQVYYHYMRVNYIASGSTGSLTAIAFVTQQF